jgi:hypothetical protein
VPALDSWDVQGKLADLRFNLSRSCDDTTMAPAEVSQTGLPLRAGLPLQTASPLRVTLPALILLSIYMTPKALKRIISAA